MSLDFDDIVKLPWRDMLSILLRDAPTNCTWMTVSDFISNTYSQEQIVRVNFLLWKTVDSFEDNNCEEADDVRNSVEEWWYAIEDCDGDDDFNTLVAKYLKEKEHAID